MNRTARIAARMWAAAARWDVQREFGDWAAAERSRRWTAIWSKALCR